MTDQTTDQRAEQYHSAQTNPNADLLDAMYYKTHLLCDSFDLFLKNDHSSLLRKTETKKPIGRHLVDYRSTNAVLSDLTGYIAKIMETEQELRLLFCDLQRSNPYKHKRPKEHKEDSTTEESQQQGSNKKNTSRSHKSCCLFWCDHTEPQCRFKRVPVMPPAFKEKHPSLCHQITRFKKVFKRRETCDRLGLGRNCSSLDLRYCRCHPFESKTFLIRVPIIINGTTIIHSTKVMYNDLPIPHGPNHLSHPPTNLSKGIASDQRAARELMNIRCMMATLALQQTTEMHDIDQGAYHFHDVNPTVRALSGLNLHEHAYELRTPTLNKKRSYTQNNSTYSPNQRRKYAQQDSTIDFNSLTTYKVNLRTGFHDIGDLLCFVAIVCGGEISKMTEKTSYMSWLEGWFFYFEVKYGHVCICWTDYSESYKIGVKTLQWFLTRITQV